MTAPELSADERAIVARFALAEEPEEIRVERVAHAMWVSHREDGQPVVPWSAAAGWQRRTYARMAAAAIAALDPS